jgi:hypothetical protein|tara:strand:- start:815 stop:985 length:171 start_codon:yes stop_codon:yes gene_type:complete
MRFSPLSGRPNSASLSRRWSFFLWFSACIHDAAESVFEFLKTGDGALLMFPAFTET